MTHFPPHIKPMPHDTVLLIHYFEDPDELPMVMTGYIRENGEWNWHDPFLVNDETEEPYEVHAWMPLPLIPERP